TRLYEQFGHCFPPYEPYQSGAARGKVLLCPPHVVGSAMLRNLGRSRTAILTGWAVDPNCRYRYQCDAAFPLSDHADFPQLLELVKQVRPKKVYTLHGFAADFARTLRELGFDARALSENEQLALSLNGGQPFESAASRRVPPVTARREDRAASAPPANAAAEPSQTFHLFALTCSQICGTTRKTEKIRMLADYLRPLRGEPVAAAATWFTGRPFPANQNKVLQLGWAVLRDALCAVAEVPESALRHVYLQHSDLGETAFEILRDRDREPSLTLMAVDRLFQQLHAARGPLAKRPLLTAALAQCSALEAKYLVKIITGDLRIGLKEGLVEEAVAAAFGFSSLEVRQANLLLGDIGDTARAASEGQLSVA